MPSQHASQWRITMTAPVKVLKTFFETYGQSADSAICNNVDMIITFDKTGTGRIIHIFNKT